MALNGSATLLSITNLPSVGQPVDHVDSPSSPMHQGTLWMQKLLLPLVLFGVFGHIMAVLTVRPFKTRDSSVDLFFTALAVTDFCVLVTAPFVKWVQQQLGFRIMAVHNVACKLILWVSFTSPPLSAWLLVAFTAQRAVSVQWPHKVNVLCTRRRSWYVIIGLCVIFPLLYSHVMYGYALVTVDENNTVLCTVASAEYAQFLEDVFVYYDMVIFTLVPFLCMTTSNGVLVWRVTSALKMARVTLTSGASDKDKERERKVSAITVTAIVVSTSFLVLTLPYLVNNFFFAVELHIAKGDSEEEQVRGEFISEVLYFLANTNFALNFYLYCLTGSKFRNEFRRLITCKRGSSRALHASKTVFTSAISATSDQHDNAA